MRRRTSQAEDNGDFRLLASGDGRNSSIRINQQADFYSAQLTEGETAAHAFEENRFGWLQVARGGVQLPRGSIMQAGDGARIEGASEFQLTALHGGAEVLLFDLP